MKATTYLIVTIALLAASGCSTSRVGLTYHPSGAVVSSPSNSPSIAVGSFVDQRGETATWFGAIRGGYGNPIKKLEATPSVSGVVQAAFADGVRARGLQVSTGAATFQIAGIIRTFDCSQMVRREAHVVIDVTVFDNSTGKQVFLRTYSADELEGSLLSLNTGVFGSVEVLRALAEKALTEVVDKALDDTALQNSMHAVT